MTLRTNFYSFVGLLTYAFIHFHLHNLYYKEIK